MLIKNKLVKGFFITGTDTNIGKTIIAKKILDQFKNQGYQTAALKPVASGCEKTLKGLRNSDALLLQQSITLSFNYSQINPFAFLEPIAPYIAAQKMGVSLRVKTLLETCQPVLQSHADCIVVEGVGGWNQPLNDEETMADFAKELGFPVIVVVGIRLGCINHSLLTVESLKKSKVKIAGWIANRVDKHSLYSTENIELIHKYLKCPLLGILPYREPKIFSESNEVYPKRLIHTEPVTEKDFHAQ